MTYSSSYYFEDGVFLLSLETFMVQEEDVCFSLYQGQTVKAISYFSAKIKLAAAVYGREQRCVTYQTSLQ